MRKIIRNADMKAVRQGIRDGLTLEQLAKQLQIAEESLSVYYPPKNPVKKRATKKKVEDNGESS